MKNPTKAQKLRWTREAVERIASGSEYWSCNAFYKTSEASVSWYENLLWKHSGLFAMRGFFNFHESGTQERLMWLCFLITLIEHGEPELTNV